METNMTKVLILLATLSATAAAGGTNADQPSAGKEFGYFVGTWKCQEKWSKSDITPAYDSTSTLVAANNTDGVWVAWSYVQDASAKNPTPTKGNDLWGYDPAQKIFVREKADNYAPGAITHLTSKGFVGDTIAWEGQVHTPKGTATFKHSFKKVDDHTIEGHLYLNGQAFYQSTCKKS
jgi:hypothetical protein